MAAKYKITLTVGAAQKASVEKKLRTAFALEEDAPIYSVEKLEGPTSRAARLVEAEEMVDQARQIVEELKDEMEQWHDTIPENLQGGDKAQEVEAAKDALDELQSNLEQLEWSSVEFPGMF